MNASLAGEYSITSEMRSIIFSAVSAVKKRPACNMWRVAVFELAAANFCTPNKALLSGVLPSLASLRPVASRIICK